MHRKIALIFGLICLLLASLPPIQAAWGIPTATDPTKRVHDFAQTLSADSRALLEQELQALEQETTAQVAVVTVSSLEGETVENYAHSLFNTWGIGQKAVNNGVLFLISPPERRTRIEVGYGLEPLLSDGLCGEILDTAVIPHFKESNYEQGVLDGAREIVRILRENPEAAQGVPGSAPKYVRTPRKDAVALSIFSLIGAVVFLILGFVFSKRENYSTLIFVFLGVGITVLAGYALFLALKLPSTQQPTGWFISAVGSSLVALFYNLRKFMRFGPHGCSKCGSKLVLLPETEDNSKLTEVQKLEEQLGSVDYDVWFCPACLNSDTIQYVATFSSFVKCPNCQNMTAKETRTTVRSATRSSTGLARINGNCVHCKHTYVRNEVIPRISSSSGGSGGGGGGGSFGGGSSGGGGSSRSW